MEGYELKATVVILRDVGGIRTQISGKSHFQLLQVLEEILRLEGYEPNPLAEGIRTQGDCGDSKAGAKPRTGGIRTQGDSKAGAKPMTGGIRTQGDCGAKAGGKPRTGGIRTQGE